MVRVLPMASAEMVNADGRADSFQAADRRLTTDCDIARPNRDRWQSDAPDRTTNSNRFLLQSVIPHMPGDGTPQSHFESGAHKTLALPPGNPTRDCLLELRSTH